MPPSNVTDSPTGVDRDPGPRPLREDPPAESLRTRLWRHGFNLLPAYRGTGARVDHIGADWRYVRVRIPFGWRTRNGVGTTFGGSLYGAIDPVYMTMLQRTLGDGFTVWDKSAAIEFIEPGRDTLYAEFELDDDEPAAIRDGLTPGESTDREYLVSLVDETGRVHAACEKTLYVRRD
jgi:acyl-coenzyme A thioesterase PaaI-like protein